MHIKRKQLYVLTLSIFALVSLVYLNAKDRLKTLLHDESTLRERPLLQLNWSSNCVPSDHIFFLKTHKCASSTVQNILMRRGFEKGLNFVLPEKGNYIGHPYFLDETKHIGKGLLAENEEYDMFVHHSRFTPDAVRRVMPNDSKWITVMREPVALFDSSYHYFSLGNNWLKNKSLTLKNLLSYATDDIIQMCENRARFGYAFGHNQMAFDLGMDEKQFRNETAIETLISTVTAEFDLVLVADFMLISLVLLADLLCWPLEQMAFIALNTRETSAVSQLTELERKKILELNNVDSRLYDHLLRILKAKIEEYGVERIEEDVMRLAAINDDLESKCLKIEPQKTVNLSDAPLNKIENIVLLPKAPLYCEDFVKKELVFTEILRLRQKKKFKIKSDLKYILNFK